MSSIYIKEVQLNDCDNIVSQKYSETGIYRLYI